MLSPITFVPAPFPESNIVPADKSCPPDWSADLLRRGAPETFRGGELRFIGMPVGGLFCGTVYLGGDGRTWLWDIFNRVKEGIVPNTLMFRGQEVKSRDGSAYIEPPEADKHRLVAQGFELTLFLKSGQTTRALSSEGFSSVEFCGQYPIGTVGYRDADCPVTVRLEAFSPFIPLDSENSSLPATIWSFHLHNSSAEPVELALSGWLENAALKDSPDVGARQQSLHFENGWTLWHGAALADEAEIAALPDFGSMGLALLGEAAQLFDVGDAPNGQPPIGRLGRKITLSAGESAVIDFVLTWYFPNVNDILGGQKRHYAARFDNAASVARYVAAHFERLAGDTRLWRDTWNDSTLPHWFLNRTFANTSTLATTTCHRFDDGRFWAWEGIGCCEGTCTHVWHYAHAMGRLFPEVERDHRERVDFGLALDPDTGIIRFRAENGATFAVDGQAGRILGAYREHQMSGDDAFLRRLWPFVKLALERLIATDGNRDGLLLGPLHNTLDADWFGVVPWICSLYHAALKAGQEMALEMGDSEFAGVCGEIWRVGTANLDALCWNEAYGYYVHIGDAAHPNEVGAYEGCHIDQVLGTSWAWQVGFGPSLTREPVRRALEALWRFNFVPDVGPFRELKTAGRWYALDGDAGLIMVSYPFQHERKAQGAGAWSAMYFNECMSGFEHQVASHMMWEGMTTQSLSVSRAIHDRYGPKLRNPYNEIECSDHYARAMASYGTFLGACGFGYHGPRGFLAFAPRLTPEHFRAAFVCAQGWGTFEQRADDHNFRASIELKWGRLTLRTLSLQPPQWTGRATVTRGDQQIECECRLTEGQLVLLFKQEVEVQAGQTLSVCFSRS